MTVPTTGASRNSGGRPTRPGAGSRHGARTRLPVQCNPVVGDREQRTLPRGQGGAVRPAVVHQVVDPRPEQFRNGVAEQLCTGRLDGHNTASLTRHMVGGVDPSAQAPEHGAQQLRVGDPGDHAGQLAPQRGSRGRRTPFGTCTASPTRECLVVTHGSVRGPAMPGSVCPPSCEPSAGQSWAQRYLRAGECPCLECDWRTPREDRVSTQAGPPPIAYYAPPRLEMSCSTWRVWQPMPGLWPFCHFCSRPAPIRLSP